MHTFALSDKPIMASNTHLAGFDGQHAIATTNGVTVKCTVFSCSGRAQKKVQAWVQAWVGQGEVQRDGGGSMCHM